MWFKFISLSCIPWLNPFSKKSIHYNRYIFLITALLYIMCEISFAQNRHNLDSLENELRKLDRNKVEMGKNSPRLYDTNQVNILCNISKEFWGNNSDSAMEYAHQSLKLAEEINYQKGIANAYNSIGSIYDDIGDFPSALDYYNKSLRIREAIMDKEGIAYSYNNIGVICKEKGDYPAALKNYLQSLKIREEIGDKKGIAGSYNNIGIIQKIQGNYQEALKNYQNCLKIQNEISDTKGMVHTYNNIGVTNQHLFLYEEALKNYILSLKLSEQIGDKKCISIAYNGIGSNYSDQKRYDEALKNYFAGLKIIETTGDKKRIASTYNQIGDVYYSKGNMQEALSNEQKGISIAKEVGDLNLIKEFYNDFAKIYSKTNNYKLAYENTLLYSKTEDSLLNMDEQNKIFQLQKQNQFDKKLAEQDKKDALAAKDLKEQKQVNLFFIIGFGLVLLLAIILFNRKNIMKRSNILITKEKQKVEVEKLRSDKLLYNILPVEVANELKESGTAKAIKFPSVTIMFTDFKDFSHISEELSPENLVKELDECFRAFDQIIGKYNIEKIKTIGDSYMCAGGLPVINSTHPIDVVNAAIEIRNYMEAQKQIKISKGEIPLEIRIGINTGTVVAGIVGEKKFAYDIWGDAVNIASRMESSGLEGKINISSSTYELVKDKFHCVHRGKIQAKKKGEVDMYFLEELG
jgi:adenylate cyclase